MFTQSASSASDLSPAAPSQSPPPPSQSSSSSSQIQTHDTSPPPSPLELASTIPLSPLEHPHYPSPEHPGPILESPPLDSRPFTPHVLGIGIASPRPMFGPLSQFHNQLGPTKSSPVLTRLHPSDVPFQNVTSTFSTDTSVATPASSSTSSTSSSIPTVSLLLPAIGDTPPLSLPPPLSGTSQHPFEHTKSGSQPRSPCASGPLSSPPLYGTTSEDTHSSSPALAQGSTRSGNPAAVHLLPARSSSSPRSASHSSLGMSRGSPSVASLASAGLSISMPPGSSSLPTVRSPLGQELSSDATRLLPSPEIRTNDANSPSGGFNPFNFQPPGLSSDGSSPGEGAHAASTEEHPEHPPHNPFRHSDSHTDLNDRVDDQMSQPSDPAAPTFPQSDPHSAFPVSNGVADPTVHPSNPLLGGDVQHSEDLTEFDTEGYSTLEKIYLFSRSRVGFHRVFIAKSLGVFLRGDGVSSHTSQTDARWQDDEGLHTAGTDSISPDDAVQYVLPLLNGLAMDEDEAVKEALATELVPIIWWFVTRCQIVEDDALLLPIDDASPEDEVQGLTSDAQTEYVVQELESSLVSSLLLEDPDPQRADSESVPLHAQILSELHRAAFSPDPTSRQTSHPHSLVALTHSSPSDSPHSPLLTLPLLPPPHSHTPDHPSPLGTAVFPLTVEGPEDAVEEPTLISVQSFTPILGTLLLSSNSHVGGPARYAVVELLRRVRKADDHEHHTMTQLPLDPTVHPTEEDEDEQYSDLGLFGEVQRRLFEREMIYQVVIGMGKLDLPDENENQHENEIGSEQTSATGTPHASAQPNYSTHRASPGVGDSYFPPVPPPSHGSHFEHGSIDFTHHASPMIVSASSSPAMTLSIPMPPPISSFADFSASGLLSPPLEMTPSSSVSSSASSLNMIPTPSPFTFSSPAPSAITSFSIPSLVSGSSSYMLESPLASSSPTVLAAVPSSLPVPSNLNLAPQPPAVHPSETHAVGSVNFVAAANGSEVTAGGSGVWNPPRSPGDLPLGSDEERQRFGPRLMHSDMGANFMSWTHGISPEEEAGPVTEEAELVEEAAVGRLSSMSLMAAVTASVIMAEEHQTAFVTEVQRVGRDPVYWVRREASFVVGALAKVVPTEVVTSTLLPLFEVLCHDTTWQVRHSALFALPAILSRLPPEDKHRLALDVILPFSRDESPTVRSGVLEALAEVMYTFHEDPARSPEELVKLFLGIREGESQRRPRIEPSPSTASMSWSDFMAMATSNTLAGDHYDIYDDLTRPLVCAFNFPAVALTLGRERWPELRELYLELSLNSSLKVRRTLAASLGEMAKIIGPEYSRQDLLGVWWGSVRAGEGEVRLKAVECLSVFVCAVEEGERTGVVSGLVSEVWDGKLKGWREREGVMLAVGDLVKAGGIEESALRKLVMKGIRDPVAAIREAAVTAVTQLVEAWSTGSSSLQDLFNDIRQLGSSGSFRERTTYIACQQEIFTVGLHSAVIALEEFWETLFVLVQDIIVDVRIKVARLLSIVFDRLVDTLEYLQPKLLELVQQLAEDVSTEVKAFAQPVLNGLHSLDSPSKQSSTKAEKCAYNFSRPPPPAPG